MNSITAQGAPGSLIRRFQEHPEYGVALLAALEEMVAGLLQTSSLGLNEDEVARLKRAETAIAAANGE